MDISEMNTPEILNKLEKILNYCDTQRDCCECAAAETCKFGENIPLICKATNDIYDELTSEYSEEWLNDNM